MGAYTGPRLFQHLFNRRQDAEHSPVSRVVAGGMGFPRTPWRGREDLQWPTVRDQDTLRDPGLAGKSNFHSMSSHLPSSAWLLQAEIDVQINSPCKLIIPTVPAIPVHSLKG